MAMFILWIAGYGYLLQVTAVAIVGLACLHSNIRLLNGTLSKHDKLDSIILLGTCSVQAFVKTE